MTEHIWRWQAITELPVPPGRAGDGWDVCVMGIVNLT